MRTLIRNAPRFAVEITALAIFIGFVLAWA